MAAINGELIRTENVAYAVAKIILGVMGALLAIAALLWLLGGDYRLLSVCFFTILIASSYLLAYKVGEGSGWRNAVANVQLGASIAIKAQEVNDRMDAIKLNALTGAYRTGLNASQDQQMPRLPLSTQLPGLQGLEELEAQASNLG